VYNEAKSNISSVFSVKKHQFYLKIGSQGYKMGLARPKNYYKRPEWTSLSRAIWLSWYFHISGGHSRWWSLKKRTNTFWKYKDYLSL